MDVWETKMVGCLAALIVRGIQLLQASIVYNRKKTSVNHTVNGDLLSHIENSKNDKGYITQSTLSECQRAAQ